MIAEVAFDAPLPAFSYRVPDGWTLLPGQRVLAPLRGARRVGVVVAVHPSGDDRMRLLLQIIDVAPRLGPGQADLVRWIAAESLTSLGSTWLALLPPPAAAGADGQAGARVERPAPDAITASAHGAAPAPELLVGAGREARVLDSIVAAGTSALVLVSDLEAAARWAGRLARREPVVRLDSGVGEHERVAGWQALAEGRARLAVGTRSALLAPLPAAGAVVLIDEHELAHRPPGAPRVHARDVVLERAGREGLRVLLTSATPSVEAWWRCRQATVSRTPARASWPPLTVTDTRGIARREALTPALARAIRETLAAGRRVFLAVSRLTSVLGCDECGAMLRCPTCAVALAYSPAGRALACRLCGTSVALPETCPACHGRRLAPLGWGAERVEHAVRRRFGRAHIARYDPDATRGRRAEAQRAAAQAADVVIGTRGALRLFGPASLGLAGFVSPDQLLGLPDFRAGERMFALLWAAVERVRPDGQVVVQSQHPGHYAIDAVARQNLDAFYEPELKFRSEIGYPPFRRLAVVTVAGRASTDVERLTARVSDALRAAPALAPYPPLPERRPRVRRIVVKGDADLPARLEAALAAAGTGEARTRGIIDVEVDPVEWRF